MFRKFKFWSDLSPKAAEALHPDFGLRNWDELTYEEKNRIWHYLKDNFNNEDGVVRVYWAVYTLNERHKYRSYAENFLIDKSKTNAMTDFSNIVVNRGKNQDVVFELLSCFSRAILVERSDESISRKKDETDEEYAERLTEWRYEHFDKFAGRLNDVFEHFGIGVILTRHGLIPKQEEKIVKEIYEPVLKFLSNEKWKPVSRDLQDAFKDFRLKTATGYSSCVTHTISAIEAFLQILLYEKTGKGTLRTLIPEAQSKHLIPRDKYTDQMFKTLESIFAQERMETSDAHPKEAYANAKNALMIMNLAMVFLQHCIQN